MEDNDQVDCFSSDGLNPPKEGVRNNDHLQIIMGFSIHNGSGDSPGALKTRLSQADLKFANLFVTVTWWAPMLDDHQHHQHQPPSPQSFLANHSDEVSPNISGI